MKMIIRALTFFFVKHVKNCYIHDGSYKQEYRIVLGKQYQEKIKPFEHQTII